MVKKKQKSDNFSNRDVVIMIIIIGTLLPFMYYIGGPELSEWNREIEYKQNITKSCFIKYAKEYCTDNNMDFSRVIEYSFNQGYAFYCLDAEEMRRTGRTTRFHFSNKELKYCNDDVFEVNDDDE